MFYPFSGFDHDCTAQQFANVIYKNRCLREVPMKIGSEAICGNGEEGEQCDCGLSRDCAVVNCIPTTCQYRMNPAIIISMMLDPMGIYNPNFMMESHDFPEESTSSSKDKPSDDKAPSPPAPRSHWVSFENEYHEAPVLGICNEIPTKWAPPPSPAENTHTQLSATSSIELWKISKGDHVMAAFRLAPSDPSYLAFDRDDLIEVMQMGSEGIFKFPSPSATSHHAGLFHLPHVCISDLGCLVKDKQRIGFVKTDHVKRVRTNSMVNMHSLSNSLDGMTLGGQVIRKESTVLPRRPLPSAVATPCAVLPDYMNTEVSSQVWYMGNLERNEATKKLLPTPDGTFLVRFSMNRGKYAISISYAGEVKHTIIEQSENGTYYLDEGYVFNSIVELVNYYRQNNLRESFQALDTTLKDPYRECKLFKVIHPFEQNEGKFLRLQKGDILTLVDTIGEERGWWKGRLRDQIGFFPMSYVKPIDDSD